MRLKEFDSDYCNRGYLAHQIMNSGYSPESESVSNKLSQVILQWYKTATLGSHIITALDELEEIVSDTFMPNWDGYDALPVSQEAYEEAEKFLMMLPPNIPLPEIAPEPDGDIGFEWYVRKRFTFAASLYGNRLISYAGLFGNEKIHGIVPFTYCIPPIIIMCLRRLFTMR